MPLEPFQLGRPAGAQTESVTDQGPTAETRGVTEETGYEMPRGTERQLFRKEGIFDGVVGSIQEAYAIFDDSAAKELRLIQEVDRMERMKKQEFYVDPKVIKEKERASEAEGARKQELFARIFTTARGYSKAIMEKRAAIEQSEGKEVLRAEWLLAKTFAEIPALARRWRRQSVLEEQIAPLKEEYVAMRGSRNPRVGILEREMRPLAQELLEINHANTAWQTHLSELVDHLETLDQGKDTGYAEKVCTALWEIMEKHCSLVNRGDERNTVASYKTGFLGLRAIVNYLTQEGHAVFYPKVEALPDGQFRSVLDTEMATDLCIANQDRSRVIITQVKSHIRQMTGSLTEGTEPREGLMIDFAQVTPALQNSLPKIDRRRHAMSTLMGLSTNPRNYGIVTHAELKPFWIEAYGIGSKESQNPITGALKDAPKAFDPATRSLTAALQAELGQEVEVNHA